MYFYFFKQKTAYEMRISDWSSDVCSSDLVGKHRIVDNSKMFYQTGLVDRPELFGENQALPTLKADWNAKSSWATTRRQRNDGDERQRSEERRVGKECVSTFRSGGSPVA